jgi:hypothetical protein
MAAKKPAAEDPLKTGEALAREPRVLVRLASADGEDAPVDVGVNGYFTSVPRGETVEVPKTVADLLADAGYL